MATALIPMAKLTVPTPAKAGVAVAPKPLVGTSTAVPVVNKPLVKPPSVATVVAKNLTAPLSGQLKPATVSVSTTSASIPTPIPVQPVITTTDTGYKPVAVTPPPSAPVVSQPLVAAAPLPMAPSQLQSLQNQYNSITTQLNALRNQPFSSGTLMQTLFVKQQQLAAQIKDAQSKVIVTPVTPPSLLPPTSLHLTTQPVTTGVSLVSTTPPPPTSGPVTPSTPAATIPPGSTGTSPVSVPANLPPGTTTGPTSSIPGDSSTTQHFFNTSIQPPDRLQIALTPMSGGQLPTPDQQAALDAARGITQIPTATSDTTNPLIYVGVGVLAFMLLRRFA